MVFGVVFSKWPRSIQEPRHSLGSEEDEDEGIDPAGPMIGNLEN